GASPKQRRGHRILAKPLECGSPLPLSIGSRTPKAPEDRQPLQNLGPFARLMEWVRLSSGRFSTVALRLGLSVLNLLDCPNGVLANQRFRIASGAFQCRQGGGVTHVAERDADIAQQTAAFRPED